MDSEETRRRLRAGRALAGITVEQLAERLGPGLGAKTLYNVERGEREIRPMELREVARACGLPFAFFVMDFGELDVVEHLWPTDQDMEALGLKPGQVIGAALERLQQEAEVARGIAPEPQHITTLPDGRELYLAMHGASADQHQAIRDAVQPILQETIDRVTHDLTARVAELEESVASQQRALARAELDEELEAVAQRREPQRDSTEQAKPDRPRGGHGA